jgi:hypothetical protein
MAYVPETQMALIGVSHAASEYVVMKEMKIWFEQNFAVKAALIPLSKWWR